MGWKDFGTQGYEKGSTWIAPLRLIKPDYEAITTTGGPLPLL